uniref:Retrotransposon gag domain-containing protein n=1 Tax=Hyaloperonospora arabidopsidis (strain Emoy2) TaxID=559515 RepID=M4B5R9_HYAAE
MAMRSGLVKLDHQQVSLAISKLDGRAREWALTCSTSVDLAFPTWDSLKSQLVQVFSPPNQAYRVRSRFLSTCQEPKSFGFTPLHSKRLLELLLMLSITSSRLDLAGMGTIPALREQTTRVLRTLIGRNRWISAMLKTMVKFNFKLLSSNVLQRQATSQHCTPSQKSGMARRNVDTQ